MSLLKALFARKTPPPPRITFRPDVFVYLSGPITARHGFTVEQNVAQAVRVYLRCLGDGLVCFCPHLSGVLADEMSYATWMAYDLAIIDRCTHVMLLPRWDTSDGARQEVEYARSLGKPIVWHDWRP